MKKIILALAVVVLMGTGCTQNTNNQDARIRELESKLTNLESEKQKDNSLNSQQITTTTNNLIANSGPQNEGTTIIKGVPIYIPAPTPSTKPTPTQNEKPSQSEVALSIGNIQATPTYNSVAIRWTTNKPSSGFITNWPAPKNYQGNFKSDSTPLGTLHEITIINLSPSTEYTYNVSASSDNNGVAYSDNKTYITSYDRVAPKIIGKSIKRDGGLITLSITFDEPVYVSLNWAFNSPTNKPTSNFAYYKFGILNKTIEANGWNEQWALYYSLNFYDESDNYNYYAGNIDFLEMQQ